jgi:hypothetical protein
MIGGEAVWVDLRKINRLCVEEYAHPPFDPPLALTLPGLLWRSGGTGLLLGG